MKHLGESLKLLPTTLHTLVLNLYNNKLGNKEENIKYLGEGIK